MLVKKALLISILSLFIIGCTAQKTRLNTWMGKPQQRLIMNWGPPARTTSDGGSGQILIYARETYAPQYNLHYWDYTMMYVNSDGLIYHWRTSRQQIAPTQIDVRFLN
jgi:hypothetical protein